MSSGESPSTIPSHSETKELPPPAPLPKDVEGKRNPETDQAIKDLKLRALVGYSLGGVAIAAATGLIVYSFYSLSHLRRPWEVQSLTEGRNTIGIHVFYVEVGGHVLITVAAIWFLYQLLRAAERLALPSSWANTPEVAKTMLGIRSPFTEASGLITQLLKALNALKKMPGTEE